MVLGPNIHEEQGGAGWQDGRVRAAAEGGSGAVQAPSSLPLVWLAPRRLCLLWNQRAGREDNTSIPS